MLGTRLPLPAGRNLTSLWFEHLLSGQRARASLPSTMSDIQRALCGADCEVRFDNLTRQLYSTDASIYQIEPLAVAFPRNAQQASAVIRAAADASVPVTPRGAGTSLVGNAIGDGLIVDFSRHNGQITDLGLYKRS